MNRFLIMSHFSIKEFCVLAVVFLVTAVMVFSSRAYRLYGNHAFEFDEEVALLLYEKTEVEGLTEVLQELGLDVNIEELQWASRTLGWNSFREGRYLFSESQSYSKVFSKLARGIQDPVRVTILPGSDRGRLSRVLSTQLQPDSSDFFALFDDSSEVALEYGLTGEKLFSRMLPNSYDMYWTSSATSVIDRLKREFDRLVITPNQEEIDANPLSLEDIITLASIVEWEAQNRDEKPKISGLYLNRLQRNMMLQADPTVLYALGERRRLLFEDYQFDHPYNTYKINGLPPGPITNPDVTSIQSVLQPEEHDYLYMVATPEGTHRFSRTFEEHQQASAEWRRWLREQYRIRDEREAEQQQSQNGG